MKLQKISKIVEIEDEQETWDLEVDHSEHTFLANGISVSNCHAMPYIIVSYQTAWLYTHFGDQWCASWLSNEALDKKEQAISIVKSLGVNVGTVSLNESDGYRWISKNDVLMPPLASIKGLGDIAISEIIKHRPFQSVEQLLYHPSLEYRKLNVRGLTVLGKTGALSDLMDNRFVNRRHFCTFLGQNRKKKSNTLEANIERTRLECLNNDYTALEELEMSVELLGVFPVEKVLDRSLRSKLESRCIPPISEFDPVLGVAWCIPREVTTKKTGKGADYYIVKVTDSNSGLLEVKCWTINPDKDKIYVNRPYAIKLDYDDVWGFSTRGGLRNWRILA